MYPFLPWHPPRCLPNFLPFRGIPSAENSPQTLPRTQPRIPPGLGGFLREKYWRSILICSQFFPQIPPDALPIQSLLGGVLRERSVTQARPQISSKCGIFCAKCSDSSRKSPLKRLAPLPYMSDNLLLKSFNSRRKHLILVINLPSVDFPLKGRTSGKGPGR